MKLVRFEDWRTGLLVQLPQGPYLVDVVSSLGVFLPGDPVTNGLLNGMLRDGGSWAPVIQHWERVRTGLKRLALLASTCPDHPQLTMHPFHEIDVTSAPVGFQGIAALDIAELDEKAAKCLRHASTGRAAAPPVTENFSDNERIVALNDYRR